MRLRKRIGLLIRAKLGSWRRRDKDSIEDTLRRADKMEALLEQLGEQLKHAMARQTKLEGQLQQAKEMARQYDHRADEALRAGNEAAAREAIRHKLAYAQIASELEASLARQTAATQDLQSDVAKLESRLSRIQARTPATATTPPPATKEATQPAEAITAIEALPDEQVAMSLEALQERMNRVWSDQEVENELEAIKSRLSSGT